jgi:transposase InsO family protein
MKRTRRNHGEGFKAKVALATLRGALQHYQRLLGEYGITTSMSRTGNCWDNACIESFFGTLKPEIVYHRHDATRDEAKQDIFEYIEVFYNRRRPHSTLGYDSPAEFEARTSVA